MTETLTWQALTLQLRVPFRLSYGVSETRRSFWLRLPHDEGWGEAAIPPYYGVADDDMIATWAAASACGVPFPDDPEGIGPWIGAQGPSAARCALDLALHDRIARRAHQPLWQLLGLPQPPVLATCFTIAIADPDEMAQQAAAAAQYDTLKIKLGSDDDIARLAAVRVARPDAKLRVDANAGWSPGEAILLIERLAPFGLELIEQPVRKDDFSGMGYVQARTSIPVVADESCQSLADVEALAGVGVQGINLKLMKAGGLGPGSAHGALRKAIGDAPHAWLHDRDVDRCHRYGSPGRPRRLA